MPQITNKQKAVIQGALLSAQEAIETLASDEELVPELVRGIIIGVFLGVPQQIKRALEQLDGVEAEGRPAPDPDSTDE